MKQRVCSIILALSMVLSILPAAAPAARAAEFSGDGDGESPYLISTAADLWNLAEDVNGGEDYAGAYFLLTADIELGDSEGKQWTPIGISSDKAFQGAFDGGGHKITGVYINQASEDNQGLFGYLGSGGSVQKLGVDGRISGQNHTGSIVGYNSGTVTDCYNTGSVSGSNAGGIVGYNDTGGKVNYCYNTGAVTATGASTSAGGVVGHNSGTVANCYNTGKVSGNSQVGGVVGHNDGGTLSYCYNTGAVTATGAPTSAGGVVGLNTKIVEYCYYLEGANAEDTTFTNRDGISKTEKAFRSGEVANLLGSGAWGQNISGSNSTYPELLAFMDDSAAYKVYAVTFMDGTEKAGAQYANPGGKVIEPDFPPAREGFTFDGWYNGGTKWNFARDTVERDLILTAKWNKEETSAGGSVSPTPSTPETPDFPYFPPNFPSTGSGASGGSTSAPSPTYPPNVSTTGGGKVSASPSSPKRGDTVTVAPTPDKGYKVKSVVVKDSRGNKLALKDNGNGTYSFQQPIGKVTVDVTFEAVSILPADVPVEKAESSAPQFADLTPNSWYWEAVAYVSRSGLMNGYSDGTFGPNNTLSRAMLAQILYNQAGRPDAVNRGVFADVADGRWCADAIAWASANGIVNGYGNNRFGPDDPTSREQFAVMLYRFEQAQGGGFNGSQMLQLNYSDAAGIREYAHEAVAWCTANGILGGYTDGTLRPRGQATRAEAAAMLMRYFERGK